MAQFVPVGPFPHLCAHMAYRPRSNPNFLGDLQHDFRDYQQDERNDTMAVWAGCVERSYLEAATIIGAHTDAIADCLRTENVFDAASLSIAHDLMAAYWR